MTGCRAVFSWLLRYHGAYYSSSWHLQPVTKASSVVLQKYSTCKCKQKNISSILKTWWCLRCVGPFTYLCALAMAWCMTSWGSLPDSGQPLVMLSGIRCHGTVTVASMCCRPRMCLSRIPPPHAGWLHRQPNIKHNISHTCSVWICSWLWRVSPADLSQRWALAPPSWSTLHVRPKLTWRTGRRWCGVCVMLLLVFLA